MKSVYVLFKEKWIYDFGEYGMEYSFHVFNVYDNKEKAIDDMSKLGKVLITVVPELREELAKIELMPTDDHEVMVGYFLREYEVNKNIDNIIIDN